jgi:hypothetical protein
MPHFIEASKPPERIKGTKTNGRRSVRAIKLDTYNIDKKEVLNRGSANEHEIYAALA